MRKKLWIGLLFLSFVLPIVFAVPALAAAQNFPDTSDHWARDYILRLSAAGHINGYPDGSFKPDRFMSKAEFITVLISCKGVQAEDTNTISYSDTNNHWAEAQINEAVKRGILIPSEDPNGLLPDESVKRSQAAAMLVRALGKQPDSGSLSFNDQAVVEKSMYRDHIKTAYDLGLISGFPDGNFEPFQNMTRAQVSTVLSRFLDLQGNSSAVSPPLNTGTGSGNINTVVIEDESYSINSTPVYFKVDFTDIKVSSLTVVGDYLVLNGSQRYELDSFDDNPDIIVNNNRYGVNKMSISGNKLVVSPACRKFNRFTYGGYGYNADYIKIYINSANSEDYLSDLEILDEYRVELDGDTYNLKQDKITVALNKDFYDITKINLSTTDTTPQLIATDPVIFEGMSLSDIMAIFTGASILDLSQVKSIDFMLGGKRYNMSQVILDAQGNFTADSKSYSPDKAKMIINRIHYNINHIEMSKSKFIIYAGEGSMNEWVLINDEYRDPADVKIIWSGNIYNMDDVLVVSRDLLRIDGRQYELDSSFKVRFDNKIYDIDRIDYDSSIDATTIDTGSASSGYLANQPQEYVFFKDDREYQEGTADAVIYANGSWIEFDQIIILDPSHFTYKSSNYDLIDARVKIDRVEFYVVDTAWHGLNQVLDIHLEEK